MHDSKISTDNPGGSETAAQRNWLARWIAFLETPVDGSSLAIFRICFGVLLLCSVCRRWSSIAAEFIEPQFFFGFIPGLQPLTGVGMYALFAFMGICAVLIAVGFCYRFASIAFFLSFTYVFLLEKAYYYNNFYLVVLVNFLLCMMPANQVWSIDSLIRSRPRTVPRWCLLALQLQFGLVYFCSGLAKLNPDWFTGEPMSHYLLPKAHHPIWRITQSAWFLPLVTYGGIVTDLSVSFLLFWRKTFWLGAAMALTFNLMNSQLLKVGIFPWLMIASIGLYAAPDWPLPFVARVCKVQNGVTTTESVNPTVTVPNMQSSGNKKLELATLAILHVWLIAQILIPLRHYLYPGNYLWTNKGYYFSWSMFTADKRASIVEFNCIDPKLDVPLASPEIRLSNRQKDELGKRPEMILQYARALADRCESSTGVRPRVTANVMAALNYRNDQQLIDPSVDLASRSVLLPENWIVPFQDTPIHHRSKGDGVSVDIL